jgi:acetyl esterase/lipase
MKKQYTVLLASTIFLALTSSVIRAQTAKSDSLVFDKQTYTYKTVDDQPIKADVYRTPTDDVQPVIMWIHGGALIMGSRAGIRPQQLAMYLGAGNTVICIDYRLAPETKLPQIIEDVRDAYTWIRETGPDLFRIDPDRIAVIGHSAGGYLTLMTGFCVEPRPKALVPFYGYGDIVGDWYTKPDSFYNQRPSVPKDEAYQVVGDSVITYGRGRSRFYLYCRQNGLWPKEVSGHDPEKEPGWFDPYCPVRNVTKDYPPTLLLHGDKDTDVPFRQSVLMAEAFDRNAVEHDFIELTNLGHGFDGRDGMQNPIVAAAFESVLAFLQEHNRSDK